MNSNVAMRIMERFVELPLAQRQAFLSKMRAEEMDFSQFPIPASRAKFKEIPASYAQRRQWFLWQFSPESAAYNMSAALRLDGQLDKKSLKRAFATLQSRHESLRTHFSAEGEHVLQIVHPEPYAFIDEHALPEALAIEQKSALIKLFVENETSRAFDFLQGPLLRLSLLKVSKDSYVLVLVQHHIVSDGWSMGVIVEELLSLYAGYSEGRSVELPELPIQYADYAIWQKQWLEAGESERQLAYWTKQLGEDIPVLEIPSDRSRPTVQSYRGAMHDIVISAEVAKGLNELAQRSHVTVFMVLLASFQTLLHRYSGQSDIRVGVPIANRNRVETERLIGFFVNTQVLKADIDSEMRFSDLLVQVKRHSLEAQAHQDLPFEQLVEALHPERNLSHHPLFQVILNHQTERRVVETKSSLSHIKISALDWENKTTPFDLTLDTTEYEGGIDARLRYATDLFDASTIARISDHWIHLLQSIITNPEQRIGELSLQSEENYLALVKNWTNNSIVHTSIDTIHQKIETRAKQYPESIAVALGNESLTYQALNSRANQLAHQLRRQGIGPESRVGLAVERSLEMIVGIVAILKAGGAYVPLDPAYPVDRLHYMIEDSGIQLLLTQAHLKSKLSITEHVHVIELEADISNEDDSNPISLNTPDNLAYIIYTSGSTGKPKGALLTHHHVMRLFKAAEEHFEFTNKDVWSVFHSYAFDFSVWEIFGGLLYGGKLVIVPFETSRSPKDFYHLLKTEGITILNQTPSAFLQLQTEVTQDETIQDPVNQATAPFPLALRYVIFGGEALDIRNLKPWFERYGDISPKIINMYGITETTVHVTYRQIKQQDLEKATTSPIGQPLNDLSGYVLDASLHPVLPGCRGEIYIGGAGLARGYHRRAGLTAERFVPDPFGIEGTRLYRTGDVAQRSTNQVINYEGRLDHQVKIRGFRIELGEIEAKLQSHPEVHQAVLIALDTATGTQLVGYIVAKTEINPEAIKAYLKEDLPDYMVPAYLVSLDALPLTTNGKLDKQALPVPEINSTEKYVAPRTALEKQLAEIWQEVLNVPQVGLNDNFFDLGGHSLLAVKLTSTIKNRLNMEVGLHHIMFEPTLKGMAGKLRGNLSSLMSPVVLLNGPNIADKKKIFCLHPGGGSSYCYYPLAESLKENYAVYGLMCRTFVNKEWIDSDWNELVGAYTQYIRDVQPEGPYYLLGWSLGGGLAMSINQELERMGEEVKFLGLIDTLMPVDLDVQIFMEDEARENKKDMVIQSRDDHIKPEFAQTIEFMKNILPVINSKEIIEGLKDVDMEPLNKDKILEQVLLWIATNKGMDYTLLKEAAQNFALESEISVGHELMDRFDRLSKSFINCHVKTEFNVWLASLDKTQKQLDLLQSAFDSIGKAKSIEQIEATHNDLIFSTKLLSSIREELLLLNNS